MEVDIIGSLPDDNKILRKPGNNYREFELSRVNTVNLELKVFPLVVKHFPESHYRSILPQSSVINEFAKDTRSFRPCQPMDDEDHQ